MMLRPHPTGALWIEEAGTALVADAHLGYGWAQRRRGELGPVRDDRSGVKLARIVDELAPREIVFLGDAVHAPRPGAEEREFVEGVLTQLMKRVQVTVVSGNHDRHFLRDYGKLGLIPVSEWRHQQVIAIHGDKPRAAEPGETLILGHLHPSISVADAAGAKQRLPVFLLASDMIILPAFSPFAAGIDLTRGLTAQVEGWIGKRKIEAVATTGTRLLRLGPLSQHTCKAPTRRNDRMPIQTIQRKRS